MITEKETAKRAAALDRAAEGVQTLTVDARKLMGQAGAVALGRDNAPPVADVARAAAALARVADDAFTEVLAAGGVTARIEAHKRAGDNALDLSDLSAMSSDATRELLAVLDRAQELAERVDAERGRCVGANIRLQPGESRGTDYAEAISNLALRLRGEAFGPVHAGRE